MLLSAAATTTTNGHNDRYHFFVFSSIVNRATVTSPIPLEAADEGLFILATCAEHLWRNEMSNTNIMQLAQYGYSREAIIYVCIFVSMLVVGTLLLAFVVMVNAT